MSNKAGRPKLDLTDEERKERQRAANLRSKEKHGLHNITLDNATFDRLNSAKEKMGKKFGFELTNKQFMTIMLNVFEEDRNE